jgi:hypothetical protein
LRTKARFGAQYSGGLLHPSIVSKRPAAADAFAQTIDFSFRLGLVEVFERI